jgi:UDP-glucose 6-dehydrogenase
MERGKPLVVGLGEVGGALTQVLEANGPVSVLDVEPFEITGPVSVMHVCFPFQQRRGFVPAVVERIKQFAPSLTIINSTVLPGTTRSIALATGAAVAYSPIRGKHAKMVQDLRHYNKFVASPDRETARRAEEHFRSLGMKTSIMAEPETLELAKLAETTYFGIQIAFAQELNRYADRVGGEYSEAVKFFEEVDFLPRVTYFPGFIGGHCVIPNIHLLQEIDGSPLLDAILESNARRVKELQEETTNGAGELTQRTDGVSSPRLDGAKRVSDGLADPSHQK